MQYADNPAGLHHNNHIVNVQVVLSTGFHSLPTLHSGGIYIFGAISYLARRSRHGENSVNQCGCVITYITSGSIETGNYVLHMLTPSSVGSAYFQNCIAKQ